MLGRIQPEAEVMIRMAMRQRPSGRKPVPDAGYRNEKPASAAASVRAGALARE